MQPYSIVPRRRRLAGAVKLNATRIDKRTMLVQGKLCTGRVTLDSMLRRAAAEGQELATALLGASYEEKLIFLDHCEDVGWHRDAAVELRGTYSAADWIDIDLLLEVGCVYKVPTWRMRGTSCYDSSYALLTRFTKKSAAFRVPESDAEFGAESLHQLWTIALTNRTDA